MSKIHHSQERAFQEQSSPSGEMIAPDLQVRDLEGKVDSLAETIYRIIHVKIPSYEALRWRSDREGDYTEVSRWDERLQKLRAVADQLREVQVGLLKRKAALQKAQAQAKINALLDKVQQLSHALTEARRQAWFDGRTGLFRFEAFDYWWEAVKRLAVREFQRAIEQGDVDAKRLREGNLPKGSYLFPVVVEIDLDQFKAVNDRLGHEMGDVVLLLVADALRKVFRRHTDLVTSLTQELAGSVAEQEGDAEERIREVAGRLGGDEFRAVALTDDPQWRFSLAVRLREALADVSREEKEAGHTTENTRAVSLAEIRKHIPLFGISVGTAEPLEILQAYLQLLPEKELVGLDLLQIWQDLLNSLKATQVGEAPSLRTQELPIPLPRLVNVVEFLRAASKEMRKTLHRWEQLAESDPHEKGRYRPRAGLSSEELDEFQFFASWIPGVIAALQARRAELPAVAHLPHEETSWPLADRLVLGTFREAVVFYTAKLRAIAQRSIEGDHPFASLAPQGLLTEQHYTEILIRKLAQPPESFHLKDVGVTLPERT